MEASSNIAQHLPLMAGRQPDRAALKIPRGRDASGRIDYLTLSFAELDAEVDAWAAHLTKRGVKRGDRTLVMVRQGLPLIAAAFALFKIGAVPIVIDPGMGLESFLKCVARSKPRALLGIPFAQVVSRIAWKSFRTVEVRVWASGNPLSRRGPRMPVSGKQTPCALAVCAPTDLAAILFTSGSTGAPKGVCYEHGMFDAQVRMIRATYQIEPGEVDLPMLPIFALFNPALGMTTVVPEIDPSKPATVDPARIVQAIQQEKVTNSFGSPTLWGKIGDHCLARDITLPTMKRVLCAGAPVPATLWEKSVQFLPNGKLHSPYGATEALPVSTVSSDEVLSLNPVPRPFGTGKEESGVLPDSDFRGACVGRVVNGACVKIVEVTDGPIASLEGVRNMAPGEIGEILVAGPMVTKVYDAMPEETSAAKIQIPKSKLQKDSPAAIGVCDLGSGISGGDAAVWHRMGDCGYLDIEGRLWFCGRKAERVITAKDPMYTEPCERVFRSLPGVVRCALIGLGKRGAQTPALVVQPSREMSRDEEKAFALVLRDRALEFEGTRGIETFYFHPAFPVDVRHNAKIHRLTLAKWAVTAQPHRFS
jgi:acyl-CoA synthetase (AMP-forming)/AMP-acid ligase II